MAEDERDNQPDPTRQQVTPLPLNVVVKNEVGEQEEKRSASDYVTQTEATPTKNPSPMAIFVKRTYAEAKPHDLLTVFFTAVIAISTVVYTVVATKTLSEIKSGSADTHALAQAASKQASHTEAIAGAAGNISTAAGSFSTSSEKMQRKLDEAVADFKQAADQSAEASKTAAGNAEKTIKNAQDSFRDDQRAWIGPIEFIPPNPPFAVGNQPSMGVILINSGKTPGIKFTGVTSMNAQGKGEKFVPVYSDVPVGQQSVSVVFPNSRPQFIAPPVARKLIQEDIDTIKNGTSYLYVYGELTYYDVSKRLHHTTYCFFLKPDLVTGGTCAFYNNAD